MEFYGGNTPENVSGPGSCAHLSIFRADRSIHSLSLSEAESRELRAHIRRKLDGKRREIHAQNSAAGSMANPTLGSGPGSSQGSFSFGLESTSSLDDSGHMHTRLRAGAIPIPARGAGGDEGNDVDGDWETVEESANGSQRILRGPGTHYENRSSIADTSYEGSLTPTVTPDISHRYQHQTRLSRDHTHPLTSSPPITSSRGSPLPRSSSDSHLADLLISLRSLPVIRPSARSLIQRRGIPPSATAREVSPHLHPLPRLPIYLHDTCQALLSRLWLLGLLIPFPMLLLMGHDLWDGVLAWQTGGDITCIRRREKYLALVLGYGLALCWMVGMVGWMLVGYR